MDEIRELKGKIVALPKGKRQLTDEEIIRKCPTCQFTRFVAGRFECQRRVCKYRTSRKSRYFKDK